MTIAEAAAATAAVPEAAWVASLPCFDLPELTEAHAVLWRAIAARLGDAGLGGLPDRLSHPDDLDRHWRSPWLLLSQADAYPYATQLSGIVRLVATPRYRAHGCSGGRHRGLLVVRRDHPAQRLIDLRGSRGAIDNMQSNTGMNLLRAAVAPLAIRQRFFGTVQVSGSAANSLAMIGEDVADLTVIDCVTYAHLARLRPALVEPTRVLAVTAAAPCPPLITAASQSEPVVTLLRTALKSALTDSAVADAANALLLTGFEIIPDRAYRLIRTHETQAAALGYPNVV
ncbi:MAG: PhnD/SsuA/transferrin family substrate-binding protein [Azospirillaceae bacterium]|nr:PhnD/SsuA/transferrin family substrate-binding protein [Azospirillaceae bacterium]